MKINRSRSKRKILYTLVPLLVLVLVVAGASYFVYSTYIKNTSDEGIDYSTPSQEQVDAGLNAKQRAVANDQKTDASNGEVSFTVKITSASINSDKLQVRSAINGIFGSGSCELTLRKGDKVVRKSSGTQSLPQMSTCKGFDIPLSELSPGTWQVDLSVSINKEAARATTNVEIQE